MSCPNYHNQDVTLETKKDDGQGYWELEQYSCSACGCEWEWEMTMEITKKGKKEE
jgi:hypothetical protein